MRRHPFRLDGRPYVPHDLATERRLIAVVLRDTGSVRRIPETYPTDFCSELHRRTFDALRCAHARWPDDSVSLDKVARLARELCGLTGPIEQQWREMLTALDANEADLETYAAVLVELAIARKLVWSFERAAARLRANHDLDEVLDGLLEEISECDRLKRARRIADDTG